MSKVIIIGHVDYGIMSMLEQIAAKAFKEDITIVTSLDDQAVNDTSERLKAELSNVVIEINQGFDLQSCVLETRPPDKPFKPKAQFKHSVIPKHYTTRPKHNVKKQMCYRRKH